MKPAYPRSRKGCEHGDWALLYLSAKARRQDRPEYVCGFCGHRLSPAQWRAHLRQAEAARVEHG